MLHTMHFLGLGRTHDDAFAMAGAIADRTFSAIALLNGQRISQLNTLLLPDPAPSLKQIALVYVLDVPAGGAEIWMPGAPRSSRKSGQRSRHKRLTMFPFHFELPSV